MGGVFMSAEIIQFIRGRKQIRDQSDLPNIAFRSAPRPGELAMDHADTAPCEYVPPEASPPTE
jgi:hypothetical protein